MTDTYRTVAGRSGVRSEVNGSELIGYVPPAGTVEEAEALVTEIEECHPDATHNVPAYRVPVGPAPSSVPDERSVVPREHQSDDGRPSGSLGKPALDVPIQRDVRNVAAVVTHHYGGTNLGVGGLVRAYSRAVKETLDVAGAVEEIPHERFTITIKYDNLGSVRGLLEGVGAEFEAVHEVNMSFEVRAPVGDGPEFHDRIWSATSGCASVEQHDRRSDLTTLSASVFSPSPFRPRPMNPWGFDLKRKGSRTRVSIPSHLS